MYRNSAFHKALASYIIETTAGRLTSGLVVAMEHKLT